ncbi:hypothetical protein CBM2605_B100249 [Cupriavidus neocaledonicus]|uniref:Transposase n=1 Tax=Cupriavidus neocaledonicus TaxID=1040979 RepID=A0ABY1V7F9_9BURK|nr:hypothetical protein CBM2605_B100249 [Cupriavidus neocaledonicus]
MRIVRATHLRNGIGSFRMKNELQRYSIYSAL